MLLSRSRRFFAGIVAVIALPAASFPIASPPAHAAYPSYSSYRSYAPTVSVSRSVNVKTSSRTQWSNDPCSRNSLLGKPCVRYGDPVRVTIPPVRSDCRPYCKTTTKRRSTYRYSLIR